MAQWRGGGDPLSCYCPCSAVRQERHGLAVELRGTCAQKADCIRPTEITHFIVGQPLGAAAYSILPGVGL